MCSGQRCIASTASDAPSATCPSERSNDPHASPHRLFGETSRMASESYSSNCFENVRSSDAIAVKYGEEQWTWREHLRDASARAVVLLSSSTAAGRLAVVLLGDTPSS